MSEVRQPVITLMFNARIRQMAEELAKMHPRELDPLALRDLHAETTRLLEPLTAYERTYGLPQESHEG